MRVVCEKERGTQELTLRPRNQTMHIRMLYSSIHCKNQQQFPLEVSDTS